MRIQIDKIKVNPGRREALPEHIEELSKSIAEVGLLNPIRTADSGCKKFNTRGKSDSSAF